MAKKKNTSPRRIPSSKQMGEAAIRNVIRPYVPELIAKALELVDDADNDSVKLGAIKLLLSKVVPDLKATDIKSEDLKDAFQSLVIIQRDVKD